MVSNQPIDAGNTTIASWLKPQIYNGKSKHKEVDIHPLVVVGYASFQLAFPFNRLTHF
jgi:hypothetical protein